MAWTTPVLIIVLCTSLTGASFLGCLRVQVSRALHRLKTSGKQSFYLLDGMHVDKLNSTDSDLKDADADVALAGQTDRLFDDHDLLLDLAPEVQLRVHKAPDGNYALSLSQREGRTFGIGARKRLQMALLPIMYKLGVITTLLVGLTVLTLKAITIGVVLLILAFGGIFTKIKSSPWDDHQHGGPHKDVHIHVHPFTKPHWYKTWHRQEAPGAADYEALDSKTINTKVPAPASYLHSQYNSQYPQYHYHQPSPQYAGAQYAAQHYNTNTAASQSSYPSSFGQLID